MLMRVQKVSEQQLQQQLQIHLQRCKVFAIQLQQ